MIKNWVEELELYVFRYMMRAKLNELVPSFYIDSIYVRNRLSYILKLSNTRRYCSSSEIFKVILYFLSSSSIVESLSKPDVKTDHACLPCTYQMSNLQERLQFARRNRHQLNKYFYQIKIWEKYSCLLIEIELIFSYLILLSKARLLLKQFYFNLSEPVYKIDRSV